MFLKMSFSFDDMISFVNKVGKTYRTLLKVEINAKAGSCMY